MYDPNNGIIILERLFVNTIEIKYLQKQTFFLCKKILLGEIFILHQITNKFCKIASPETRINKN